MKHGTNKHDLLLHLPVDYFLWLGSYFVQYVFSHLGFNVFYKMEDACNGGELFQHDY